MDGARCGGCSKHGGDSLARVVSCLFAHCVCGVDGSSSSSAGALDSAFVIDVLHFECAGDDASRHMR